MKDRFAGFGGEGSMPGLGDMVEFPTYQERMFRELGRGMEYLRTPACTGLIALRDREQVRTDIENLRAAVQSVQTEDVFMTAASPGESLTRPSAPSEL